ncbi:MAG: glycine zipper family protein [Cytophagaceae bacterium]
MKSINSFWKKIYLIPVMVGGLGLSAYAQYPGGSSQREQDEYTCSQNAQVGKHKALKDAGIGAAGGAVAGKILGKPGAGAVVGGAAGGVYGHKKSKDNNGYSSKKYTKCMRDKGYNM